jgi:putative transposase
MTDEEWELIADLVAPYSGGGRMGRPVKNNRRDIVNAIFYVAATGCQWRALPACYPNWNTVHRYHLAWSRDGTWEAIAARLAARVRHDEGHHPDPSAGVVDARSVRGAASVTGSTRGYDAGKKISGRKTFGVVDTLGLLIAVVVVAASTSDNAGGIEVVDRLDHVRNASPSCGAMPASRLPSPVTAASATSPSRWSTGSTPAGSSPCPAAGSSSGHGHG